MTNFLFPLFALCLLVLLPAQSSAQHIEESQTESHEVHFHPNHVALFLGATSELKHEKNVHSTAGVDYIRRLGAKGTLGVGGFAEAIFKEHLEGLLGAHVYFYPTKSLWVMAGGGIEFHKEDPHEGASSSEIGSSIDREVSFLFRTGIGYNFELGGFTVAPAIFLDAVRETDSLVWGVSIGKGF